MEFIELERDEAQPLVEKYNKEGRAAQPPDAKRFRGNDSRDRYSSGSRFSTPTCASSCVTDIPAVVMFSSSRHTTLRFNGHFPGGPIVKEKGKGSGFI